MLLEFNSTAYTVFPKKFILFTVQKKASSLQNAYRKCGTHEGVFSPTLGHGKIQNNDGKEHKPKNFLQQQQDNTNEALMAWP